MFSTGTNSTVEISSTVTDVVLVTWYFPALCDSTVDMFCLARFSSLSSFLMALPLIFEAIDKMTLKIITFMIKVIGEDHALNTMTEYE